MQSQQKRVKWSRGETAEALEERTDTGITMASVELMENCIPDIYGNISRRPALKLIEGMPQFTYDKHLQVFPFYISEDDFLLVGVHYDAPTELIRVHKTNGTTYGTKIGAIQTSAGAYPKTKTNVSEVGTYVYKPVAYAQQNNYMIIADGYNTYKLQIVINAGTITPTLENWQYSAGWYAPNGTQTKQITASALPGLAISGHFYNYVFTDNSGISTMYKNTDTGLDGLANLELISQEIPVGSIIQMPNAGCYFRVEGYYNEADYTYFSTITFDALRVHNEPNIAPGVSGKVCVAVSTSFPYLEYWLNNVLQERIQVPANTKVYVKSAVSGTGYSSNMAIPTGSGFDFRFTFGSWVDASVVDTSVRMFGALLTPVADENATDDVVNVEYGYQSLQPTQWSMTENYPHPNKLTFLDQRLWAGGWQNNSNFTGAYSIVIGSQIGRYNDFKNDYNQENEPITLDILTQFKEHIVHLVDYNGLKIMTDAYEYAYEDGAIVKQSGNGSLEECEPLVFESLCLYCDSTGNQIKAMQYEFQSNIFNSSGINTIAPKDLIWYPTAMAAYEDKINSTGKHLFVINKDSTTNPKLAVCNFVPNNQANIWSRWAFPSISITSESATPINFMYSVVRTKAEPIFLVVFEMDGSLLQTHGTIMPAILDFNGKADAESPLYTLAGTNYYAPLHTEQPFARTVMPKTEVAIYADGEFQFLTTTGNNGEITADLTGLTNITVGLPINSTIRSHPIDVGGKTKSVMKRIGKTQMSVHDTPAGAITINGKTGYMNTRTDHICFYGVTGMKDEIKYTITNNNGAMFHLESLLMNIEYGTLDS